MYLVKVFPSVRSDYHYLAQIFAGLYDLESMGLVKLEITNNIADKLSVLDYRILWMEATDLENNKTCKICFDMFDGGDIKSMEVLIKCNVYFKRSYSKQFLKNLEERLQEKVKPYGLLYDCISPNEKKLRFKESILHYSIYGNNFYQATAKTIGYYIQRLASKYMPNLTLLERKFPSQMVSTEFEVHPEEPAERKILFQTRIWDPAEVINAKHTGEKRAERIKRIEGFNHMRVETLKALKKRFRERFIGGLRPSEFAQKNYPELVTLNKTSKKNYIDLVKTSLIAVTTCGRLYSTGLKLAEYVAASRCIVSEPLYYSLPNQPVPFQEETNYLAFSSPMECVEACEKILNHPQFANQMRRNNYDYYNMALKPSALIGNCLKIAIESV